MRLSTHQTGHLVLVTRCGNVLHPRCVPVPPHPRLETDAVILRRYEHCRNRQCFPDVWRSLHRLRSTLPAATPPDSRLGCWMDEYPWSSRGRIFCRIRVSEYDPGSSLDGEGQFTIFIRSLEAHE